MDKKNETDLGVQNRFDLLALDDPLSTQQQKPRRRTKKYPKTQVKTIDAIQNNEKPSQDQAHVNPDDKPCTSKNVVSPKANTDTFLQKSVKADKNPSSDKKQVKTIDTIQNNEKPSHDPNEKPGTSKKVLLPNASTDTFLQKSVKADKKGKTRQITFEEYKAKNLRLTKEPIYNTRLPGEGEDSTKWEKLVPLEKTKLEPEVVVVEDSSALGYSQKAKRHKPLPLKVRFNDRIIRYGISRQIVGDPDPQPEETKPPGPPIMTSEEEFPHLGF